MQIFTKYMFKKHVQMWYIIILLGISVFKENVWKDCISDLNLGRWFPSCFWLHEVSERGLVGPAIVRTACIVCCYSASNSGLVLTMKNKFNFGWWPLYLFLTVIKETGDCFSSSQRETDALEKDKMVEGGSKGLQSCAWGTHNTPWVNTLTM